jgi:site-specific recombinase XerD
MIESQSVIMFTTWAQARDLRPATLNTYLDRLRLFGVWYSLTYGAPLGPKDLTTEDVKQYRAHLVTRNKSAATVNTSIAALASWAQCFNIELGEIKKVKAQPSAPNWLDNKQQSALVRELEMRINGATTEGLKMRATMIKHTIVLMLHTGLRVSEVCALGPDSVRLTERTGALNVIGKGSKLRAVPLNKTARAALRGLALPLPIQIRGLERALNAAGKRLGIPRLTPHVLRHTFAHNLALSLVAPDKIAAILGHANLNTTRIYTQPGAGELAAAVELMD